MILYLPCLVAFLSTARASCLHATSHLQRLVGPNNTVEVSKFGYTGGLGPLLWQTLATEYMLCEQGAYQSPINIGISSLPQKALQIKSSTVPFSEKRKLISQYYD
jgi:carbonic anhydrase